MIIMIMIIGSFYFGSYDFLRPFWWFW